MLVAELVDLSLQLVRLLLLDHLDIAICDLLDLCQAAVGEAIALETNLRQCRILVQGFEHDRLDLLTEEIVAEADLTDALIALKCVDEEDDASIVEAA